MSRIVKQYLNEAEEDSLVDQVQKENSTRAIELLCTNFKNFIESIINSSILPGIERDDLLQEGRLGIINAAKTFDKSRGVKFADYAMSQIRSKIVTALRNKNIVSLPRKDTYSASKFKEADENLVDHEQSTHDEIDDPESFFHVLDEKETMVINLTYYENMKIADIANLMKTNWREVHKWKLSAILKLKKRMQGIVAEPKVRCQVNNERWGEVLQDIFSHKFKRAEVLEIKYSISLAERELIEEFHVHGTIQAFAHKMSLSMDEARTSRKSIEKKMAEKIRQMTSKKSSVEKSKPSVLNSAPTLKFGNLCKNV